MKKETKYNLVKSYQHLFSQAILKSLGLHDKDAPSKVLLTDVKSEFTLEPNHFRCGEGWSPIIEALTAALNEINSDIGQGAEKEDDKVSIKIGDIQIRHKSLSINFESEHNLNSEHLIMMDTLQKFASEMSKRLCEICGAQINAEESQHSRCAICKCKRL